MATSEQEVTTFPTKKHIIHVTNHRLIFEKQDSGMTGAIIGGVFGGAIGGAIGGTLQKKLAPKKQQTLDILLKNKKLYTIPYETVESIAFTNLQRNKRDSVQLVVVSHGGRQELDVDLSPEKAEQVSKVFFSIPVLTGKIHSALA